MEINAHCLGFCNNCKYRWFERKLSNSAHMKTGKSNNSHNFLSPCFSSSLCPPVTYTSFVYGKVTVWSCYGVHQGHEDHTRLELPHPTMQGGVSIHPLAQGSISNSIQRAQPQRQAVMGTRLSLESSHQVSAQWSVRSARQNILGARFGSGLSSFAAHSL